MREQEVTALKSEKKELQKEIRTIHIQNRTSSSKTDIIIKRLQDQIEQG